MNDLKDHLFDVIERLKEGNDPTADKKDTIDMDRAGAIVEVAKVIVDAAKTEVQALNVLSKALNPTITAKGFESAGVLKIE